MIGVESLALFYRTEYDENEMSYRIRITDLSGIDKFSINEMDVKAYQNFIKERFNKYQDIDGRRIEIK